MDKNISKIAIVIGLIILIVFLLILIPQLLYTGSESASTPCLGEVGNTYTNYCYNVVYLHSNGNISATLNWSSNYTWSDVEILFVQYNNSLNASNPSNLTWNSSAVVKISNGLAYGTRIINISMPATGPVPVNQKITGQIWARYKLDTNNTFHYSLLGTIGTLAK